MFTPIDSIRLTGVDEQRVGIFESGSAKIRT